MKSTIQTDPMQHDLGEIVLSYWWSVALTSSYHSNDRPISQVTSTERLPLLTKEFRYLSFINYKKRKQNNKPPSKLRSCWNCFVIFVICTLQWFISQSWRDYFSCQIHLRFDQIINNNIKVQRQHQTFSYQQKKPNQFDQLPTLFLLAIGNDVASVCTRKSSLHLTSANACDIVAHNSNEISLLMPMDKKNGQKARWHHSVSSVICSLFHHITDWTVS